MDPANRHIIFPTNSPLHTLAGEKVETPLPMTGALHALAKEQQERKLQPLLKARKDTEKVYSKGYFENHYKDADKKLKKLLHEKVMAAWANSISDDQGPVEEPKEKKGLSLNLTISTGD
jgi:hypothetical protein